MITEDYVSFETAKLLKEKGFNEPCGGFYVNPYVLSHTLSNANNSKWDEDKSTIGYVSAPTLQMAIKWLREVYNYHICLILDSYVEPFYNQYYIIIRRNKDNFEEFFPCEQVYFETYEKAAKAAIKYILENLI